MLGLVENLGLHGYVLATAKVYVGILAATILFIATNAGVIGASRITYAMASHRQLPEIFRRLHPKLKTPWLALVVFGGVGPTIFLLSGQVDFLGADVRVRRDALVHDRARIGDRVAHPRPRGGAEWRARPNIRIGGIEWPLFAIVGGLGTGAAWLVVVVQDSGDALRGFAWLAVGFIFYALYRRHTHLPLTVTMRAPVPLGPALALEYRSILVTDRGGAGVATRPSRSRLVSRPSGRADRPAPRDRRPAGAAAGRRPRPSSSRRRTACSTKHARSREQYGVRVVERVVRARHAGRAIVDEAERRGSEIIVLGARARRPAQARSSVTPSTMSSSTRRAA